ncbi:MAG: DoxX family membrane protein [Spirosomataceae bacterium]
MYGKFIVGIRAFLGLIFFTAGMAKIYYLYGAMFPGLIGPPWLEERLVQYGLGLFARFIAYTQIIVGLLLLTQRFATLGAVMLFPMLLCIFVVTVSLEWQGTPYVNFFLLVLNGILLAHDFPKLKFLFVDNTTPALPPSLIRRYPQFDLLWIGSIGVILLSTFTVRYSAPLSYGLVLIGLVLTVTCQVWQRRKQKNTNLPSNP